MPSIRSQKQQRRGAVVPLTALLLIVIMAFLAFAIDLGYALIVRAQLQNAADAAALAGASQMLDSTILQGTPWWPDGTYSAVNNANAQAQGFALKNYGGGVALVVPGNTGNTSSGDIVCGNLSDPSNNAEQMSFSNHPYNSVQVRVRRDSTSNGPLSLFFARALGFNNLSLEAQATATYQGNIVGFSMARLGGGTCKLLPYTLDVNTWNQVLAGNGPDNWTRSSNGTVTNVPDGIPECKLFPLTNGSGGGGVQPGNFGTVDIGAPGNSTKVLDRQILNGPNAEDLSYYPGGVLQLDQTKNPPSVILNGDTGISAGAKDDLTAIIGQPRIIPLYSSVTGNGNNANYTIVAFVGITITEVVLTGSLQDKHITIQPCYCIDGSGVPSNKSGVSWYVSRPLALVR
jgi:Flp pilus assembly protein TadG